MNITIFLIIGVIIFAVLLIIKLEKVEKFVSYSGRYVWNHDLNFFKKTEPDCEGVCIEKISKYDDHYKLGKCVLMDSNMCPNEHIIDNTCPLDLPCYKNYINMSSDYNNFPGIEDTSGINIRILQNSICNSKYICNSGMRCINGQCISMTAAPTVAPTAAPTVAPTVAPTTTPFASAQCGSLSDQSVCIDGNKVTFYSNYSFDDSSSTGYMRTTIFKFGDLIQRAIDCKNIYPSIPVSISLAVYKLNGSVAMNVTRGDPDYGKVVNNKSSLSGDHRYKTIKELFVIAGDVGVSFKLIYNMDLIESSGETDTDYTNDLSLSENVLLSVYKTCEIRKANWNPYNNDQMHNKFMTISHHLDNDGSIIYNSTYVTTSNIDTHTKLGNTSLLFESNVGLYNAYGRYYNIIWNNYESIVNFRSSMTEAHRRNLLNYDTGSISAYFYPNPQIKEKSWDVDYNMVTKVLVEEIDRTAPIWVNIDMWHFKFERDGFGHKLVDNLNDLTNASIKIIYSKDSRNGLYDYVTQSDSSNLSGFHSLNGERNQTGTRSLIRKIDYSGSDGGSHSKNFLFASSGKYWIITGSTNIKTNAFSKKGNNQVMIRSGSNKLYNLYNASFTHYGNGEHVNSKYNSG